MNSPISKISHLLPSQEMKDDPDLTNIQLNITTFDADNSVVYFNKYDEEKRLTITEESSPELYEFTNHLEETIMSKLWISECKEINIEFTQNNVNTQINYQITDDLINLFLLILKIEHQPDVNLQKHNDRSLQFTIFWSDLLDNGVRSHISTDESTQIIADRSSNETVSNTFNTVIQLYIQKHQQPDLLQNITKIRFSVKPFKEKSLRTEFYLNANADYPVFPSVTL
jgi:hypothetical protein